MLIRKTILLFVIAIIISSCQNKALVVFKTQEDLAKEYIEFINNGSKWEDYKDLIADGELLEAYYTSLYEKRMQAALQKESNEEKQNKIKEQFKEFINGSINVLTGLIDSLEIDWDNRLINISGLPLEFISVKGTPEKKAPGCDENVRIRALNSDGQEIEFFVNYICNYNGNYKILVDKPFFMPIIDDDVGMKRYRKLKLKYNMKFRDKYLNKKLKNNSIIY